MVTGRPVFADSQVARHTATVEAPSIELMGAGRPASSATFSFSLRIVVFSFFLFLAFSPFHPHYSRIFFTQQWQNVILSLPNVV